MCVYGTFMYFLWALLPELNRLSGFQTFSWMG